MTETAAAAFLALSHNKNLSSDDDLTVCTLISSSSPFSVVVVFVGLAVGGCGVGVVVADSCCCCCSWMAASLPRRADMICRMISGVTIKHRESISLSMLTREREMR